MDKQTKQLIVDAAEEALRNSPFSIEVQAAFQSSGVATKLGILVGVVDNLIEAGQLRGWIAGDGIWRVTEDELKRYQEENEESGK